MRGRKKKYPWDKWFRRKLFRLVRGVHYTCAPHGMAQQVRNVADVRRLRVSISIAEETLTVSVLGESYA